MTNNKTEGVEDLQTQVRNHIKSHGHFDWHEALTENEMGLLEDLLLTFMPLVPPGSNGYEKLMKAFPPAGVEQRAKGGIWMKTSVSLPKKKSPAVNMRTGWIGFLECLADKVIFSTQSGASHSYLYADDNLYRDIFWLDETQSIAGSESQGQEAVIPDDIDSFMELMENHGWVFNKGMWHQSGYESRTTKQLYERYLRLHNPPPTSPK